MSASWRGLQSDSATPQQPGVKSDDYTLIEDVDGFVASADSGATSVGGLRQSTSRSTTVKIKPCNRGNKLTRIMMETAIAATESAVAPSTAGTTKAIPAAIKTAKDRNVSAQTCCERNNNTRSLEERIDEKSMPQKFHFLKNDDHYRMHIPSMHCTC